MVGLVCKLEVVKEPVEVVEPQLMKKQTKITKKFDLSIKTEEEDSKEDNQESYPK
jgi:hypothetical protein